MPQSYAALYAHFVFSTKDRAAFIDASWKQSLYEYLGGMCRKRECVLIDAGGVADHVHLLVSMNREISVADFMREIKSGSSAWIHQLTACKDFAWQNGYAAFSVSHSNLQAVREYLSKQEMHHRKIGFKEEFVALLEKHNIEFDERYIWS